MSITSYFSTSCETRELHSDVALRTRYYRNSFKDALKAVESLQERLGFEIRDVNQTHGEIYVISNGFDLIFTMTQVTPIETGIDMKVNYFSFIGMGKPKKTVQAFYKEFDKLLKFKGVALHP